MKARPRSSCQTASSGWRNSGTTGAGCGAQLSATIAVVDEQRHDRVGVGAGGDLDAVEGADPPPQFYELRRLGAQPIGHRLVVIGAEISALGRKAVPVFVRPRLVAGLGEHEKHLEIAQVAGAEAGVEAAVRRDGPGASGELGETRVAFELPRVDVDAPREKRLSLGRAEIVGGCGDRVDDGV